MLQQSPKPANGSTHPENFVAGIVTFGLLLLFGIGARAVLPHGPSLPPLTNTILSAASAMIVLVMMLSTSCRRWTMQVAKELYPSAQDRANKLKALKRNLSRFIFYGLIGLYAYFAYKLAFTAGGIGETFSNWLQSCAVDAHVSPGYIVSRAEHRAVEFLYASFPNPWLAQLMHFRLNIFENLAGVCKWLVLCGLVFTTWKPFLRAATILSVCSERIIANCHGSIYDALISAIKQPTQTHPTHSKHPFMDDCHKSLCWLAFCYVVLFSLIAFCPGDLGECIRAWLSNSVMTAYNYSLSTDEMQQLYPFLASIIAMYAAVPFAIMSGAFLPAPRAAELRLTDDWILFPESYLRSLNFRLLRSIDEIKRVNLKESVRGRDHSDLSIEFTDGAAFRIRLDQAPAVHLFRLFSVIDENASEVLFNDACLTLMNDLSKLPDVKNDKGNSVGKSKLERQTLRSTTFSLHRAGEVIPGTKARIVKLLASESYNATYLVRNEDHRLYLFKQYYLPACAALESGGVTSCDPSGVPGLVQVVHRFAQSQFQYLVYEHVKGVDLEAYVAENGPQDSRQVLTWAIELAELLHQAQSAAKTKNSTHFTGEVSPRNIILDELGSLRIRGYTLPKDLAEKIVAASSDGEGVDHCFRAPESLLPESMLPESMLPKASSGLPYTAGEVYAFGATLAFLLTGDKPIPFCTTDLTLAPIECSPLLIAVIKKCTEVDPEARFESFSEIVSILEKDTANAESHHDRESWLASIHSPDQLANMYIEHNQNIQDNQHSQRLAQPSAVSALLKKLSEATSDSGISGMQTEESKIALTFEKGPESIQIQNEKDESGEEKPFEYVIRTRSNQFGKKVSDHHE